MKQLKDSGDWNTIKTELKSLATKTDFSVEINKMISNISKDVTKLSNEEVEQRRKRANIAPSLVIKINNSIEEIHEFIVIGTLISK